MKNRKINLIKLGALFFGIFLLLFNCEKEEHFANNLEKIHGGKEIKLINANQLKEDILFKVQSKTGYNISSNYLRKNKKKSYQNSIDINNIVQVIDTLGNTSYTFRLNVNDNDNSTFYNLIVNETTVSREPNIYVHKFISNKYSLEAFIKSNYNFKTFSGKILKYNLSNFLKSHSNFKFKNKGGIDDCICDEVDLSDGSTGGSGGGDIGNTGDSYSSSGGSGGSDLLPDNTPNCNTFEYVAGCEGSNAGRFHLNSSCGFPGTSTESLNVLVCGGDPDVFLNKNSQSKVDDCNNPCAGTGTGGDTGILLPLNQYETIEDHCPDL